MALEEAVHSVQLYISLGNKSHNLSIKHLHSACSFACNSKLSIFISRYNLPILASR